MLNASFDLYLILDDVALPRSDLALRFALFPDTPVVEYLQCDVKTSFDEPDTLLVRLPPLSAHQPKLLSSFLIAARAKNIRVEVTNMQT